jgi:hypothetical protein
MLKVFSLPPVEGVHPNLLLCGIDPNGVTYCHPGNIGLECVHASCDARVNAWLYLPDGRLPLVPIKWARAHFSQFAAKLDAIDVAVRSAEIKWLAEAGAN